MKSRALLAGALSLVMLSASGATTLTALAGVSPVNALVEAMPIMAPVDPIKTSRFLSFTGTVKEIHLPENASGFTYVLTENTEGALANFVISADTYIVDDAKIAVGDLVTGYYDGSLPMILIYPPQYPTLVLAVGDQTVNLKVDLFDQDMVSSDNTLKLNLSEDTKITLHDGTAYDGDLVDRKLLVKYTVSTRSIPAQTNPSHIVVLSTEAESPETTPVVEDHLGMDISKMDIVVSNQIIAAPAAFADAKGTVMVPLRAMTEALGYTVHWEQASRQVSLGESISFKIGEDQYQTASQGTVSLGTPAVLKEGITYVPLKFFKSVLLMNNAYVFEAQIVVDNEELMH